MGRKPDYEILYKVSLALLIDNNIDVSRFNAADICDKVGCTKSSVYSYLRQIERDFFKL